LKNGYYTMYFTNVDLLYLCTQNSGKYL